MIPLEMPEHIKAIEVLNSYVRSDSARQPSYSTPTKAIYWLKSEAIRWADQHLTCQHETVRIMVTCRGCSGAGKYVDSYGHTWPHCHACGSTGRHYLYFVETRIQCGPTWHTPWIKFYVPGKQPPFELFRVELDWQPNQKGHDLSPDELARNLNIVESFWTKRPDDYWTDWGGPFNHFNYKLYVGATPNRCSFCGLEAPEDEGWRVIGSFGVSRGRIQWQDHACHECEDKRKNGLRSIFEQFPVPQSLTSFPNIQLWMERNNVAVPA